MPTTYDNHLPADRSALGNLKVAVMEGGAPAEQNVNINQVSGQAQTARDWSLDLAKLQNVDLAITALRDAIRGASNKTLSDVEADTAKLDIALSALRDALRGASNKTLTDIVTALAGVANLDVALSTRATESTLASVKTDADNLPLIKAKTDNLDLAITALRDAIRGASSKTLTDIESRLASIQTTLSASLDATISTRATEATLSGAKSDLDKLVPTIRGTPVFNSAYMSGNPVFGVDLTPGNTPCIFRVSFACSVGAVLTLIRKNGAGTVNEQLNGGNALAANALYSFDVVVASGDTINLTYAGTGTILSARVIEVDAGLP